MMRTAHLRSVSAAILLGLALGCAGYRITPGGTGSGYDVYRPEPYVLLVPTITRDAKNTRETIQYKGEIIWLPNYQARYRVKTWNHFGKADFDFEFDEGWKLTSLTDKSDNTEPMKTLVAAAKELAIKSAASGKPRADGGTVPTFQLYKLVYGEDGVLIGLARVGTTRADSGDPISLVDHRLPPPEQEFEWPGLLGGLSWLLGFGNDSY